MIRRSLAVLLLVLAASPLTAPFQTWHLPDEASATSSVSAPGLVLTISTSTEAGALIGPLRKGERGPTARELPPVVCGTQQVETSAIAIGVVPPSDSTSPPLPYPPLLTVLRL